MLMFRYYLWYYLDLVGSIALLSGLFFVLETVAPAEERQPLTRRLFNLAYYPLILVLMLSLTFAINPLHSWLLQVAGGGLLPRLINPPKSFIGQLGFALLFALVWDLWQYGLHRLQHAWPVLWETHKFHHSETALNSSVHARHHFSHHILYVLLSAPVVLCFGALSLHVIAAFVLFRIWGFVNHANLRLRLGPLTPLIAGPQWHRIHHSIQEAHQDKNFAAFFPFIDMLFGTYYRPGNEEYPATGLLGAESSGNLRDATVEPVIGFYRLARARRVSIGPPSDAASETVPAEAG